MKQNKVRQTLSRINLDSSTGQKPELTVGHSAPSPLPSPQFNHWFDPGRYVLLETDS